MIREFVSRCHAEPIRLSFRSNQIYAGNLGLFSAVFGVPRNLDSFTVCPQHTSSSLVEPFRRSSDAARSGTAAFHSPAEHSHAVRDVLFFRGVHGLAIASAAEVGEPCARDQATRLILRLIDRWKQLPIRFAMIDRIVGKGFTSSALPSQFA